MSSKLKLTGLGGGDTILQGNDSITTDQTFTLPDNGGEIVTAPAGGSVVGYQQGTWAPTYVSSEGNITGFTDVFWARWIRQGNQVSLNFYFRCVNASGYAAGDRVSLEGLPYSCEPDLVTSGFAYGSSNREVNVQFYVEVNGSGGGQMIFTCFNANGVVSQGARIGTSLTYLTDDTTWTPSNGATIS